jgi:lysozyme
MYFGLKTIALYSLALLVSISGADTLRVPDTAIQLVKQFEGCKLNAYIDANGYPTIGYGHKLVGATKASSITEEEAQTLLEQDLQIATLAVQRLTSVPLNDQQLSALIDFVYNLGAGTYQHSTLRMKLNRGEYKAAAEEFKKWVYAGSIKLPGLIRRRQLEADIFRSNS